MPSGTDDDVAPEAVLRALGKKYSPEILGAAYEERSAQELSEGLDIPIATSYRRIEELQELGLLTNEDSVLTEARNRTDVYRRDVSAIRVSFGEGTVTIDLEERSDLQNVIDDAWRSL